MALSCLGVMVAISPHLDDAVLSCGRLLAARPGSVVITVFAGMPGDGSQKTDWDQRCGFENAAQAVATRREEDRLALAVLQARPRWLDFADTQYGESPAPSDVSMALAAVLSELPTQALLVPLGLFHSDHVLVHEAVLMALRHLPPRPFLLYEDVPYQRLPGLVQQRLQALGRAGWCAMPLSEASSDGTHSKARAVSSYASQLRGLQASGLLELVDVEAGERYWRPQPQCRDG